MLSKLTRKLTGPLLSAKAREGLARAALTGKRFVSAPPITSAHVRMGAIQLPLQWTPSAESYAEFVYDVALRAAQDGAQLLVYPEYTGLPLLGLLSDMDKLPMDKPLEVGLAALGEGLSFGELLRAVSSAAHNIYLETFSTLAAGFQAYIIAGSIAVAEGRALYNMLHVFDPSGVLLGTQQKLHLSPEPERDWGLSVGQQLRVFNLPFGKVAAMFSADQHLWEVQRLAGLRGVEMLVEISAYPKPYQVFEGRCGVWARAQENACYGVLASLVGQLGDIRFGGKSGLYAPVELTPRADGVVAEVSQAAQPDVVVGEFDMDALRAYRREVESPPNYDLYRKYIPSVYQSLWKDSVARRG